MAETERFGYLFVISMVILGMVCLQILWDTLRTQLILQFTIPIAFKILLSVIGLLISLIMVGAFFYKIDKAAGRIKTPNKLFERILGDGEHLDDSRA